MEYFQYFSVLDGNSPSIREDDDGRMSFGRQLSGFAGRFCCCTSIVGKMVRGGSNVYTTFRTTALKAERLPLRKGLHGNFQEGSPIFSRQIARAKRGTGEFLSKCLPASEPHGPKRMRCEAQVVESSLHLNPSSASQRVARRFAYGQGHPQRLF